MAVPRRPEETSSNSRLALPTFRMRKRLSRSSPSATTCTSSPSVKKARRALPLGTVPKPKNFNGSVGGGGGGGGSEATSVLSGVGGVSGGGGGGGVRLKIFLPVLLYSVSRALSILSVWS